MSVMGVDFTADDFAERMAENVRLQKRAEAEQKAKELREKPWTKGEIRKYMRNFFKNQGCSMFGSGWTQKKVWSFSDTQLTNYYDRIISNLHSSGINVLDVLEKRGRLLGPSVAKRIRLDDSTDKTPESTKSFFGAQ
jgi:hypothetical protein